MSDPIQLVTTKSDQDKASEFKQELMKAIGPCLDVLNKAYAEGFNIQYRCGPNAFKQIVVQELMISKVFE